MKKIIPVALQLWSLREETGKDYASAVAKVAEIGFQFVELAGYGNLDAEKAQKAIAQAGLKTISAHVSLQRLQSELPKVVEEMNLFGCKHVVCPSTPVELRGSKGNYEQTGRILNEIGQKLSEHQITLEYHNHAWEFDLQEGKTGHAWLLQSAQPKNLLVQLDVYWAQLAKVDSASYIKQLGSRLQSLHLKDGFLNEERKRDTCEIGLGKIDFQSIFSAAESLDSLKYYVVEQEDFKNNPPLQGVKVSFENLKSWNKISISSQPTPTHA